ncbi:TPA: restriction endonuclease subunit S [Escherichia coli]|uniref:restriction endonuclease subunit S n=1 Tax=Enterobacteriaceae TaxID=543 RepID=UPI000BE823E5|nr:MULTISPECIES: restriction endonuclease subunit S [Enterobacteriaceae]EHD1573255.1 restriction endonuclease subunit S [Escherichia coli]MCG3893748.1 restriction endonuclease subunit S [Escherichia coli]MCG3901355.1 restriction endonuclease subunit S [Escherichia coli]MCG3910144.1 restriction endonuclease subunit S [Escherichia coli]MCT6984490.1 restriction endonuclease subunit S [Salmonella enterica subsp. enterica serovar Senftenberg]
MSELSYLEKLLDGVKVEWKTLEKVLKRTKGTKITAGQMKALHKDNAPLKIFAGGKTVAFVDFKDIPEKDINREPSIIVKSRGIIEFEYYDKPFSHKNEMWSYHSNNDAISIKYIYYFLKINEGYFQKIGGKMQMPQIATPDTDKFEVPIPCPDNPEKSLAIQSEIVRILDKFTALTAELTAELNMRKKQYNYYRDQLLSFKEGEVEWKTLGEVAQFKRGTAITQKQTTPGEIPVVANGPIPTYFHSESNRQGETIVIARSGAYAGYVSFWDQPIFLTDAFSVHSDLKIVKPKFIYHVLQNKQEHIHAMKKGAGVPHVRVKEFETYDIPIPPITEQDRIVSILDKFDTLTNSITEGLPREIELRQKQYEYYRDLLFSFPKPETVSK